MLITYKQYGDIAILFDGESSILVAEFISSRRLWESYFIPARSRIRGRIYVANPGIPHFSAQTLEGLCQIVERYLLDDNETRTN